MQPLVIDLNVQSTSHTCNGSIQLEVDNRALELEKDETNVAEGERPSARHFSMREQPRRRDYHANSGCREERAVYGGAQEQER